MCASTREKAHAELGSEVMNRSSLGQLRRSSVLFLLLVSEAVALCDNETDTGTDWLLYYNGRSYLNLPEVDNWSKWNGELTTWSKLRLLRDPQVGDTSVLVDITDATYAVSAGTPFSWGISADCRGAPNYGHPGRCFLNWPWLSKPMGSHFGVGAPPILVYFSGDWDVTGF